ncbi:MAG: hypothetical protein H7267_08135 [Sandarakinorhabdus sp.]|nr:hypothetical protein [Sandarakinorhabdus sp.]
MTGFGFHAAPPPAHWINDPNALIFADGRYRLFVQHRADAPEFVMTGWGRFSSDDLLHWEWDGEVLPADKTGFAYSGSITAADSDKSADLEAWHTRHSAAIAPRERQYVARSSDGGKTWTAPVGPCGPQGRNARDPYVFVQDDKRWMLIAHPCDWDEPAGSSYIALASQTAGGEWNAAIALDLHIAPGTLCEVPSLVQFGDRWALFASFVDRSGDGAPSHSGYWLGRFDDDRFIADSPEPRRLDMGPDFYAAIPNLASHWPAGRILIGWASSWATARTFVQAGAGSGGAISMPRIITLQDDAIHMAALPAAEHHARRLAWRSRATLTIASDSAVLSVKLEPGKIVATRQGTANWNWNSDCRDEKIGGDTLLFFDNGLTELFIGGLTLTAMVPGSNHRIEWDAPDGL